MRIHVFKTRMEPSAAKKEHVNAIRVRLSSTGNPAVLGEVKKCLEKTTQVKAIL